jgi:multicomponent Na+:H+ antiporter subunit B
VIIPLDVLIFLVLIITAVLALSTKDLLAAVALLAAYSLFTAILFAGMAAVDVAIVEAALGAGLTGILFIAAIMTTTRRSNPRLEVRRRYVVTPLIVVVIGLLLYASSGLPDRGDPDAPAQQGISVEYLTRSKDDTNTPNVVTALLADYRSMDTLGETLVILTAAMSSVLVLLRRRREDEEPGGPPTGSPSAEAVGPDPEPEVGP